MITITKYQSMLSVNISRLTTNKFNLVKLSNGMPLDKKETLPLGLCISQAAEFLGVAEPDILRTLHSPGLPGSNGNWQYCVPS